MKKKHTQIINNSLNTLEQSYTLDGLAEKELLDLYELTKWKNNIFNLTQKTSVRAIFFSPGLIIMF